jgi:hypothetical protein
MSGKTPLVALLAALSLAACTSVREKPTPPAVAAPAAAIAALPTPKPASANPVPRTTTRPSSTRSTPATTSPPPRPATGINANVSREPGGNSLLVTRGSAAAPVPLFRQAIVLANVRAAVAGLPAPPKAEFQRGVLTLTFPRGTQPEVTIAINRALTVPQVTRLRANLPP